MLHRDVIQHTTWTAQTRQYDASCGQSFEQLVDAPFTSTNTFFETDTIQLNTFEARPPPMPPKFPIFLISRAPGRAADDDITIFLISLIATNLGTHHNNSKGRIFLCRRLTFSSTSPEETHIVKPKPRIGISLCRFSAALELRV